MSKFYTEVARLVNKDLDTISEKMEIIPVGDLQYDELKSKLTLVIGHLLENNFEKLCQAMYRLDVSEKRFHEVLSGNPNEVAAAMMADLVIEREIQKVRTRQLYRDNKL